MPQIVLAVETISRARAIRALGELVTSESRDKVRVLAFDELEGSRPGAGPFAIILVGATPPSWTVEAALRSTAPVWRWSDFGSVTSVRSHFRDLSNYQASGSVRR